ncbi:MAG: nucleotidyltransferase, partial [Lachnospiraceae bacterium]|nr:nucleotidyltransferase [Lachnospiraceae bacterium]
NADDYYGSRAFQLIYDYLTTHQDDEKYRYTMVGYILKNTLTENGHVARGICQMDADGFLTDIQERTHIEHRGEGAAYTEDDGATWTDVSPESIVSMNMWGFSVSMLHALKEKFPDFLEDNLKKNPMKCEYFLPFVVDELLEEGRATVQVLKTEDRWYGVTYQPDKAVVVQAIQNLKNQGLYPQNLW